MSSSATVGKCSVSVAMVMEAVAELEKSRARVPLQLLLTHFQRRLPVERERKLLEKELLLQTDKAIKRGWLRKYSDGSFSIASFRWQASVAEGAFD